MEYGSMSIHRLQSGRWLNWGIRFFLTAALTASQTAGGYAPFALGCIAAAGPGADGAAALLGGVTGALLFLDFQQVLALAAVGILILTAATAFRDTAFLQKPWVLPVLAAGMVLAVDGIYVLQSLDPLSHAAPCAAASALTGVSAHFFTRLFQPEEDRLAPEGLLFLGAALTLALGDLTILNVSVGRVLLCALLAYTAYDQGPMTGVTAGLGLGLITDLSAGTSGLFTAAYGVAGLCAAKCRRRSMAALAFFSGAAAAMLTSREELAQTLLLETVAGSLLFLALPRRIFGGKRLLREAAPDIAQRTALKTPPSSLTGRRKRYAGGARCANCAGKRITPPPSTPSMTLLPTSSSAERPRPRTSPFTSPTAASICQNCCRPSMGSCRPFCCGSSTAANWKKRAAAPRGNTPRCRTC